MDQRESSPSKANRAFMLPKEGHKASNGKAEQKLLKDCTAVYILGQLKTSHYTSNYAGKLYAVDLIFLFCITFVYSDSV